MSSFEDVLVGQDDSTGTPVEQRALLFEKAKFSWANEDQIVDQALRYLRRKYPNAQLEEGSLSLNDDDADIGEVRFTLVDAAAAV